ncbi:hypothetical protein QE379_002860 [Sphingomonas sp. SORGH_AS 879]|nr:hypothetical protein [Sphingomonas sp. SORGH_AS_0879]
MASDTRNTSKVTLPGKRLHYLISFRQKKTAPAQTGAVSSLLIALVRKRLAGSDVVAKSALYRPLNFLTLALELLGLTLGLQIGVVVVIAERFLGLANQFVDVALDLVGELTHRGLHLLGIE